jgi:cation transport regulator ChaC
MAASQMTVRCADAVFIATGVVAGWRFRINTRGVATLVPEDGSAVHGILWHLSKADERTLDRYEGVGIGLYSKTTMQVCRDDGRRIEALVYLAKDDHPGRARPGYVEGIVAAALTHGLPARYLEELRRWLPTGV